MKKIILAVLCALTVFSLSGCFASGNKLENLDTAQAVDMDSISQADYKNDLEHIKNSGKDVVFVVNKIDLNKNYKSDIENTIYISVKNNINIEAIKTFISEKYQIHEEEIVINLRHYDILTKLLQIFLKLKENFLKNISNDILMIDMNEAIALLNTITGETTSNEILNNIFKHFCIGK